MPPATGNDDAALDAFLARHPEARGREHELVIYHDDSCGIWTARPCDCDPEVEWRHGGDLRYLAN